MITFTKNGGVKVISDESTLAQALKDDGWVIEGEVIDEPVAKPKKSKKQETEGEE